MTLPLQVKDQQQIEEIATLLKHTQETGSFLFVICSGPAAREMVETAIREGLGQDAMVRVLNLAEGERDLAARIREELIDLKASRPVYFIDGLPQVVAEEKARQPDGLSPTLSQLNLSRDFFATNRLRLFFWLDEPTEQELFWKAGDLWAVRSGYWSFRHEADLKAKIAAKMEERTPVFEAHDLKRRVAEQRELLQRYEKLRPEDRLGIARTRQSLADILMLLGEVEEARSLLARALDEVRDREEPEWLLLQGEVLGSLGRLHDATGQFQESEHALQEALAIFRRLGAPRGEAIILGELGGLYRERGELARAEPMLQEALAIFRRLADPHSEASALGQLGGLYRERGELARAEPMLQEALTVLRRLGDPRGEAIILGDLGGLCRERGDLTRAEPMLQEALTVLRRLGDPRGEAAALRQLGGLYRERGELTRAETVLQEALAMFRRIGDTLNEARTLDALGLVARDLKREAEAQRYTTEAERLFKAIGIAAPTRAVPQKPASTSPRLKPKVRQPGKAKRGRTR
jgi:tetratricopeptide (TPR) repeat protein